MCWAIVADRGVRPAQAPLFDIVTGAVQTREMTLPLVFGSLAGWHLLVLAAAVVLPVAAIASIVVIRSRLTLLQVVLWVAAVIVLPVVGAVGWFAVGLWYHRAAHESRRSEAAAGLVGRERAAREVDAAVARSRAAAAQQRRNDAWGPF